MMFPLDRQSHTPIYLQIAERLKALVGGGSFQVGDRLPPTRELARSLGVHRITVNNAYAELEADGIITSRVGRGTFVAAKPRTARGETDRRPNRPAGSPMFWDALFAGESDVSRLTSLIRLPASDDAISFTHALPSPDFFPVGDIRRSVDCVLRREGRKVMQCGESAGYEPLREYLLGHMAANGIRAGADEILITNGCQQSLDLIRRVFVAPRDTVLIENPTYPGAFSVFGMKDVNCVPVPMSEHGIDLDALEDVLSHQRAKLLYTTPTFHNPTGATMGLAARKRLLDLAQSYRLPIIEDDIYGELRYDDGSLPTMKALDESGVVMYLNSFSKIGFPGFRVGWIAAPAGVIDRLTQAKQACDLHTNLLGQAVLYELSKRGGLARHLKRVRKAYAERRNRMLEALETYFPKGTRWGHPAGGMSVWVELPPPLDSMDVLSLSSREGILFSPGELFYLCAPKSNTLRLTFSMTEPPAIEEGIKRLGALVRKQQGKMKARHQVPRPGGGTALV